MTISSQVIRKSKKMKINQIENGKTFKIYSYLVNPNGSYEIFKKIPRKNHIGDNAICIVNNRTTFINNDEEIEVLS
jgi:hypothetical protein